MTQVHTCKHETVAQGQKRYFPAQISIKVNILMPEGDNRKMISWEERQAIMHRYLDIFKKLNGLEDLNIGIEAM